MYLLTCHTYFIYYFSQKGKLYVMQMNISVAYIKILNVKLLIFSRSIIITHSQLFLILQSFTMILDGM